MVTLTDIQNKFEDVGGVDGATVLEVDGETYLQVEWFGSPYEYTDETRAIRDEHPELTQVESPNGYSDKTPDAMPIAYYQIK